MIDIENDVYDAVAKAVRARFPKVFVSAEYVETPARFPSVTILEADNRVLESMRTAKIENAVSVMYEVNIYSNKSAGKKTEAKEIATAIDAEFEALGFTRMFREQVPNMRDATIYRIVCRYEATVGPHEDGTYLIYQNY